MKFIHLSSAVGQLREAGEQLHRAWEDTRTFWSDTSSDHIQTEHIEPLLRELTAAMEAIRNLAEMVDRAQRECAPDENRFSKG